MESRSIVLLTSLAFERLFACPEAWFLPPQGWAVRVNKLDALQARLGGPDFHVLPLSIDRAGLEPVRRFYRETGIRNLDLYIAEDTRAMLALAVVGLPTTILIDRIGRERGRLAGPAEWNSPEAVAQISALIDERKQ